MHSQSERDEGFWSIVPQSLDEKVFLENWGLQGSIKRIYVHDFDNSRWNHREYESWRDVPLDSSSTEIFIYQFSKEGKLLEGGKYHLSNRKGPPFDDKYKVLIGNSVFEGYSYCDSSKMSTYSYDDKDRLVKFEEGTKRISFAKYNYNDRDELVEVSYGKIGTPYWGIRRKEMYKHFGDTTELYLSDKLYVDTNFKSNTYIYDEFGRLLEAHYISRLTKSITSSKYYTYYDEGGLMSIKDIIYRFKIDTNTHSWINDTIMDIHMRYYDRSGRLTEDKINNEFRELYKYNSQGFRTEITSFRNELDKPDKWKRSSYERNVYDQSDTRMNPTIIINLSEIHQRDGSVKTMVNSRQFVEYEYY